MSWAVENLVLIGATADGSGSVHVRFEKVGYFDWDVHLYIVCIGQRQQESEPVCLMLGYVAG